MQNIHIINKNVYMQRNGTISAIPVMTSWCRTYNNDTKYNAKFIINTSEGCCKEVLLKPGEKYRTQGGTEIFASPSIISVDFVIFDENEEKNITINGYQSDYTITYKL